MPKAMIVITSYSIHYTKLYEIIQVYTVLVMRKKAIFRNNFVQHTLYEVIRGFESAMSDKLSINETNAVEAAKPVKECVKDGVKKAADLYYKYDTYTGGIKA